MAELKAQTSAASYAMSQQGNALKSYYGALLENPNVRAGLATIKATEGTALGANPYATDFGGAQLTSLAEHPNHIHSFTVGGKKNKTSVAGAYQFKNSTWKEMASKLGLTDFGPLSQDIAALGLIDRAGALADLVAGNVRSFVTKVNGVWASLPGAPYGQPTKSWGFVEDAWNNALDPTKESLPGTAPAPYGPNDPQSFADARPDNQNYGGPKGLFSVDTSHAAPIGHVSRSPLGPVSPSQPAFSGLGTPRGVNTVAGMSTPGSFTSQDEKSNTGSYKNAPNAGNFVSQDERASFVDRMGIPGAVAPSASPPSPTRPDNFAYSGPQGVFSVDPAASVKVDIARPAIAAPAPAAPVVGLPSMPAAVPTRPAIAPVPAAAVPAPAVKVAAVAPPASRPAVAPARPALSPADVYGGAIGTAQTSTPGTTVSRSTSYGPTYTTNQYGAVTATAPDGTQMAAWGGIPSSAPAITGPLNNTGIAAPPSTGVSGMFGPKAKAATGTIAGAAIGGYALGPLGAMLGGLIGKNIAAGKAPLSGIFGGNNANTHVVDTFDGPMSFANAKGGLGFPSAPSNPGGYTATSSNNSAAGMRGISPGAAAAIGAGQGGLY